MIRIWCMALVIAAAIIAGWVLVFRAIEQEVRTRENAAMEGEARP